MSLFKWPRGRYNGARITGAEVRICWRWDHFRAWGFGWRHGEPYMALLGLRISASPTYHFKD